jgi:AraC family transcriptional activator of tynA and feaB
MTEPATRTIAWSTAQVHPRDRMALWVDEFSAKWHVDSEPQRNPNFFGEATIVDMGVGLQVGWGATSAQLLTRPSRQIARGDDRFFLEMTPSGRMSFSQDGREGVLTRGHFTLLDRARPYQAKCNSDISQIVLMIQRDQLLRRIGSAERFTAQLIDGDRALGGLLSPMLQRLPAQLPDISAGVRPRVAENVIDLIATALLSGVDETQVPAGLILVRIKFWIETHLADDLSGKLIAAANGVSVRHLNRLFAREDTSLMRYVWERRLARCRGDLRDSKMAHRPIGDIALSAGFKDLAHFSRAYRARYGRSASEDRGTSD